MASDSSQHDLTAGLSGQGSMEQVPVPPEVTITRPVGHGFALAVLIAGQLLAAAWMLAVELTSGSRLLSRAAFVGFVGCSAAAWWIAPRRPAWAMTIMASGCAGLLGLLLLADSQGWLGA